jgi:hypothetical protein
MLRKTLLVTTALVVCAALAYAGQTDVVPKATKATAKVFRLIQVGIPVTATTSKRGTHPAHNVAPHLESTIFSNYSKDANAQFISWYGYTAANELSCPGSCSNHSYVHFTGDNAFAFTSTATVTTKKVKVALFSYYPRAQYEVNIYSSVGGLPGNVIATSKTFSASDTSLCCTASRTVAIKANLVAGKQYFIGVVGTLNGGNAYGGWALEDTDFSGAAVDYWHYKETVSYGTGNQSTYSSPWHASTALPATGAAVIK